MLKTFFGEDWMTELNFHIESITNSEIKFLLRWLVLTKNNLKELKERVEWPIRNAYYTQNRARQVRVSIIGVL